MKQQTTFIFQRVASVMACLPLIGCASCVSNGQWGYNSVNPSSTITERTFVLAPFTSIDAETMVDVEISQSENQNVVLSAPSNYFQYLEVKVINGVLTVSNPKKANLRDVEMTLTVSVPRLSSVKSSGTGDIDFIGLFVTEDMKAISSGTGDIEGQIKATSLDLKSSGTGDINITAVSGLTSIYATTTGTGDITVAGSAEKAFYKSSGTGDIKAFRMKAVDVEARISGTGDVECYATGSFSGSTSGTGDIEVKGNPARRNSENKKIRFSD